MISPSFMATKIQKKHVKTSYRRTKQKMKIDNGIFSTVCCVSTVSLVFNFIFFLLFCRKSKKILLTKFMISYTLVDNFHLSLSLWSITIAFFSNDNEPQNTRKREKGKLKTNLFL
ncbi:solute carrier family 35 member G1-like [Sarcoptes scabiei]|nr:solute carrier family 35 member G1-like [Sarcoptes scabiei]